MDAMKLAKYLLFISDNDQKEMKNRQKIRLPTLKKNW